MTRQEVIEKGFNEEQATIYLNDFHSLSNKIKDLEEKLSKSQEQNKQLEDIKRKYDEIETERLSKEEQIALKEKKIAENLEKSNKILNKAEAKTILAGLDINDDLIEQIVSSDKDQTIKNANNLLNSINLIKDNVIKQTKEEISNLNVKPTPGNVDPNKDQSIVNNFEDFKKLSYEEKLIFKNEHYDKYKEIMNK